MQSKPEIENLGTFLNIFNEESDRGAVLTAAAFLEDRLEDILQRFLTDEPESMQLLSGFNAPLGTFHAKIVACFALGLIQRNEFDELTVMRKIRNEFAHSWTGVSFESQKVIDLCAGLPWLGPGDPEIERTSRERFNAEVAVLLVDLLWRAGLVHEERRTEREWPYRMRNSAWP